jgi:hypothetical protein
MPYSSISDVIRMEYDTPDQDPISKPSHWQWYSQDNWFYKEFCSDYSWVFQQDTRDCPNLHRSGTIDELGQAILKCTMAAPDTTREFRLIAIDLKERELIRDSASAIEQMTRCERNCWGFNKSCSASKTGWAKKSKTLIDATSKNRSTKNIKRGSTDSYRLLMTYKGGTFIWNLILWYDYLRLVKLRELLTARPVCLKILTASKFG